MQTAKKRVPAPAKYSAVKKIAKALQVTADTILE